MLAELWSALLIGVLSLAVSAQDPAAAAVALAKEEVARTARVPPDAIEVIDAAATEWRDSALGCPRKDVVYTQVITPGHVVKLRAGTQQYVVHVGAGRAVLCGAAATNAEPGDSSAKLPPADPTAGLKRAEEARADLAKTLRIQPDAITIDFFRPTTWPDSRLGCPGPRPTSPEATRGFLIQLTSGGKTYEYHSDLTSRPKRCDAAAPRER